MLRSLSACFICKIIFVISIKFHVGSGGGAVSTTRCPVSFSSIRGHEADLCNVLSILINTFVKNRLASEINTLAGKIHR
jgi:hypothetical protein